MPDRPGEVVPQLALASDAIPEHLAVTLFTVTVTFQDAPAFFRQRHCMFTRAGHATNLDKPLLTKMLAWQRAWQGDSRGSRMAQGREYC
jgi:hypothetical protein